MASTERVSVLDASNLRVERYGLPMHMAALVILDAGPLLDAGGELRLAAIRAHIEERTRSAARLRQVLALSTSGTSGGTLIHDFDITRHVHTRALPPPGDEATLLAACAELNEVPLDRTRPLWEMWLLTGLVGNRLGLLIRLHHVVADGMAALAMLAPLFEFADTPASQRYQNRTNGRSPNLLAAASCRPSAVQRSLWRCCQPEFGSWHCCCNRPGTPRLSLNQPVGPHHRLTLVRADLAAAKAVAHAQGQGSTTLCWLPWRATRDGY
jgi:diacylglycerol O-acyltransferase